MLTDQPTEKKCEKCGGDMKRFYPSGVTLFCQTCMHMEHIDNGKEWKNGRD